MPVITSPSQMFYFNDPSNETHTCFSFRLKPSSIAFDAVPEFECKISSGVLFKVFGLDNGEYICGLFVPKNGSPEINNPFELGFCIGAEFVRQMSILFNVSFRGTADYSHYYVENTDKNTCYNYPS